MTARVTSRSPSGFASRMSLTAVLAVLPSILVMVAFLVRESGDFDITACHDRPSQRICRTFHTLPSLFKAKEKEALWGDGKLPFGLGWQPIPTADTLWPSPMACTRKLTKKGSHPMRSDA